MLLHLIYQTPPQIFCNQVGDIFVGAAYIWDFLQPCMSTLAPHWLLPCVAEFLGLYISSVFNNSPAWLLEMSLLFSRRWHYSQTRGFSFAHGPWSDFLSIFYLSKLTFTISLGSVYKELATEWGVVVGLALEVLGISTGQVGRSLCEVIQAPCGLASCWSPEKS